MKLSPVTLKVSFYDADHDFHAFIVSNTLAVHFLFLFLTTVFAYLGTTVSYKNLM